MYKQVGFCNAAGVYLLSGFIGFRGPLTSSVVLVLCHQLLNFFARSLMLDVWLVIRI